jgi:hypothetical protein
METIKYLIWCIIWFIVGICIATNLQAMTEKEIAHVILSQCKSVKQCKLMLAIAEVESSMDPNAIGPTEDYGLFQMTQIGVKEAQLECPYLGHLSAKDLLGKSILSTRLAGCLLDRLNRIHKGNIVEVLIAYNAGTGVATRWRKTRKKLPTSTKNYVLNVLHIYFK